MTKAILIACSLFIGTLSWAGGGSGTSIGNGGVGIMENKKLYMLDLFEYSVHVKPAFGNEPVVHWVPKKIEGMFPGLDLSRNVKDLFMQKVSDVMRKDYFLGRHIVMASDNLDWRMVNSGLVRLSDDQSAMNPSNLVQIAIRQKFVVFIDRDKWQLLDDENKVALLIHEALYALTNEQNAIDARNVTGSLFTPQFLASGHNRHVLNAVKSLPLNTENLTYAKLAFRKTGRTDLPADMAYNYKFEQQGMRPILKFYSAKEVCARETSIAFGIYLRDFEYELKTADKGPFINSVSYYVGFRPQNYMPGEEMPIGWPLAKGSKCEADFNRRMAQLQDYIDKNYTFYP